MGGSDNARVVGANSGSRMVEPPCQEICGLLKRELVNQVAQRTRPVSKSAARTRQPTVEPRRDSFPTDKPTRSARRMVVSPAPSEPTIRLDPDSSLTVRGREVRSALVLVFAGHDARVADEGPGEARGTQGLGGARRQGQPGCGPGTRREGAINLLGSPQREDVDAAREGLAVQDGLGVEESRLEVDVEARDAQGAATDRRECQAAGVLDDLALYL